jgi:hypothetical protein
MSGTKKDFKSRLVEMASRGDIEGLKLEIKRNGIDPEGPAVQTGTCVAIRIPADAQIVVGRVKYTTKSEIGLTQTSWVDHTGEYFSDGLAKGTTSQGWSSEYLGDLIVGWGRGLTIQILGGNFSLPETSIRPS